jgi:AcrR family transcriptional regulator
MEKSKSPTRGETTRDALLDAATLVFAREGFGPANLRAIAHAAEVNPALIGYHFGGKDGLYLAVFERMTGQIRLALEPALAAIDQVLAEPEIPGPAGAPAERYLRPLLALVDGMLTHMVHAHPAWGELILREQQSPGPAYDVLFDGVIRRNLRAMVGLLQKLRPGDDAEGVRLLAGTLASQVLSIRHYRTPFMRILQWDTIGERELGLLKAMIRRNTTLIVLGD